MHKKTRINRWVLLLLVVAFPPRAPAQPTVYVSPETFGAGDVGETFVVEIRIEDFHDLRAFSVEVLYNQAVLSHTSIAQGNVFSAAGGPGGILLTAASDASQGYVLADGARIGGGGSSGSDAQLFRLTFQAIGPGASDVFFGQVLLRDSANEPIAFETVDGVIAVRSPLPYASHSRVYDPDDWDPHYVAMGATASSVRVHIPGGAPRAKLTAALYRSPPPGGSTAPFTDPDGELTLLGVTNRYWEVTSSLGEPYDVDLAFSYRRLFGPEHPSEYRVAHRGLSAGDDDEWTILPKAFTSHDEHVEMIQVEGPVETFGPGQYALVYQGTVSSEHNPPGGTAQMFPPFPNPCRQQCVLEFNLTRSSDVRLVVYDLIGREVAVLIEEPLGRGTHRLYWKPTIEAAGIYLAMLFIEGEVYAEQLVRGW